MAHPTRRIAGRLGGRRTKSAGAFTLMELVIILLLIGLAAAIAAPSMRGFFVSRQTSDTATAVLCLTQWSRSEAISRGRRCRVNIDAEGRTCFVTVESGGSFVAPDGEAGQPVVMPDGGHASLRSLAASDSTNSYIQFYPNGRSDAGTIEIVGKQGETYRVSSALPTEMFRVITPLEATKS